MIDIKTISGEILVSVPILSDAIKHEELMTSDYIALAWNSEDGRELPVGAYIEYEGERYSLYEPYTPMMVSEGEYRYNPHFHSREEAWKKQPACVYTYEDNGLTVKSKEFDWTFVGSPADAMQIIKQAIKNEVGEDWAIAIADSLPATIEISSQTSSIASILSDIAAQCETEYWVDKKENIIHLSKCERGEAIVLEVGNNVGIPSVMSKGSEYFTRYYALGSTRNVTQVSGNINGAVNKRLTLDPNVFPMGYKDTKGHYENGVFVSNLEKGEIFSKVVLFDDIYPSSDLEIADVRPRMKYRLDGGKKVKIGGTDENPIYDQYAIWYFKIKDFTFSEDSLIEGLPLSVHFKSGRLAGQEFELIYHAKAKRENTDGDVIPFDVEAGDFEIKFKESSGIILPDIAYIIPQNADKITLFNVEMPSEYTAAAQQRLLEALDKVIAREHEDNNTYEVESNPVAFYETNMVVSLGQKTMFINGAKSLKTRVLMVERRLDSPSEQKIRVGNDLIQGSTKELRENVESLNHNVDVLSAFNDLSKSIQDSYGRTQALINEAVASVLGIWILDENGNLVTEKQVVIKNNLIVEGDTASGGDGDPSTVVGATSVVVDGKSYHAKDGVIDMSEAFKGLNADVDLSDYYTKEEVNELIDEVAAGDVDLTNYYTKGEVDSKFATIDLSPYAKSADVAQTYATIESLNGVDNRLKGIEGYFATSEDAGTQIDKWNEIVAFLNATEGTTLAGILATYYTKTEIDGKITTINNSITSVDNKYASTKTWADTLASLIVNENGSVRIKANLIVDGDTSSGGEGGSSSVGIQGILLNGTTYRDENGDGIIDLGTIGGGTLTEITYEMIVEALGYTPVSSASLGSLAYKNGLTASEVGALSTSGGTIEGTSVAPLLINTSASDSSIVFRKNNVSKTQIGYSPSIGSFIYNYASGASLGIKDDGTPHCNGNTLYHTGNFNPANYLPLTGGILDGSLQIGKDDNTASMPLFLKRSGTTAQLANVNDSAGLLFTKGQDIGFLRVYPSKVTFNDYDILTSAGGNLVGDLVFLANSSVRIKPYSATANGGGWADRGLTFINENNTELGGVYAFGYNNQLSYIYIGTQSYNGVNLRIGNGILDWGDNHVLHSGNMGDYVGIYLNNPTIDLNEIRYGFRAGKLWQSSNAANDYAAYRGFLEYGSDGYVAQFNSDSQNNLFYRWSENGTWLPWKTIAFTDSNVASATKLQTARTIWGQSFDGTGDVSGVFYDVFGIEFLNPVSNSYLIIGQGFAKNGMSTYLDGNNVYLRYGTATAIGFILNSSGNVGIGTTDPQYKLDVNGTGRFTGAVTMDSTLNVGSYMTFNNGDIMYARDEGGTLRYIMGLTSVLSFGYESAYAGIDTHIYGNSIHLHHGTSRGTGLSLYSDGSSQLHGNTTINGNLVVAGDISA